MTDYVRKFIPVNQASIEPSNAVSFGAYYKQSAWKSTGTGSNFLIEFDESDKSLKFLTSNNYIIDSPITWKEIFKIDRFGIGRPTYGRVFNVVDFFPSPDNRVYNVSVNNSNTLLRLSGESFVKLRNKDLDNNVLPVGFNFVIVNMISILGYIYPEDDVVIYGCLPFQASTEDYKVWNSKSHKVPILYKLTPVELYKISNHEWLLNGFVDQAVKI